MNVTVINQMFGRYGGAEIYILQAAQALSSVGCTIRALSSGLVNEGVDAVEGIPHRGLLSHSNLSSKGIINRFKSKLSQYFNYADTKLTRELKRETEASDLLVVGHIGILLPVIEFARPLRKKVWLIVFGIDIWREWTQQEYLALQDCERIIALSKFTADSVKRRLKTHDDKVVIIHPQVDTNLFTPGNNPIQQEPHVILTVSRLAATEAYKGHDLIIRSLQGLNKRLRVPIEYQILGDGNDRSRLEQLASRCRVKEYVKFLGEIWSDERIEYYRRCQVFAMPSFVSQRADGSWTGEGFGIVYIEASACSKPVLACDEGGQTDAVRHGETGVLVKPTVDSVTDGLVFVLSDLDKASEMGKAGRQFVLENFTKERFKQKWLNLLIQTNQVIQTGRPT